MNALADFRFRFRGRGLLLTAVLAAVLSGCATRRTITLDAQNPSVRVSVQGVLFGDRYVEPAEVAEILADYDIPRTRTIHILLDPEVRNLAQARYLMGCLGKAGYTRPVLVTKRHAESNVVDKKKKTQVPSRVRTQRR